MKKTGHKLLFIAHTDNLRGGGELSVLELMADAKKQGHLVYGVVPGPGDFASRLRELGIEFSAFKYSYWGKPTNGTEAGQNLNAVQLIADIVRTQKIDCIVTNTLMIPWGALAAAITNTPHIWISRELLTLHHGHLKEYYDFIGSFSNVVMANSKSNADYIRRVGGLENVGQFYSYVDSDKLKLGGPESKPRVVCIAARIHPDKNQLELVKALAQMKKQAKLSHKTLLFGAYKETDAYFRLIKKFIADNKLENEIEFPGFIADPFSIVGPGDVFVRTSKHESLGRAITEAMKLGLITIAADIPDSKEAFELGGGVVYKSDDPAELAAVLETVFGDYDKYKKEAKQVQHKVLKNLTMKYCHKPFMEELTRCAGLPNPRMELRHVADFIKGLSLAAAMHLKEVESLRQTIEKKQQTIDQIVNSKGWRMVESIRKIKNSPKALIKPQRKDGKNG